MDGVNSAFIVGYVIGTLTMLAATTIVFIIHHTVYSVKQHGGVCQGENTLNGVQPEKITPQGVGLRTNNIQGAALVVDDQRELAWEEEQRDKGCWARVKCKDWRNQ